MYFFRTLFIFLFYYRQAKIEKQTFCVFCINSPNYKVNQISSVQCSRIDWHFRHRCLQALLVTEVKMSPESAISGKKGDNSRFALIWFLRLTQLRSLFSLTQRILDFLQMRFLFLLRIRRTIIDSALEQFCLMNKN